MDSQSVSSDETQFRRLASEYRNSVTRCLASLDQLRAAEREYNLFAAKVGRQSEGEHASAKVAQELSMLDGQGKRTGWPELERLSDREFEVFAMIGNGLSSREIAEALQISVSTVETYRERLKAKLFLENGNSLVRFATIWSVSQKLTKR